MRALLISFLLIICSTVLFSQTNVSGNILTNTTWSKTNSPYVLTGDVGIGTGVTLTIEPGVIVRRTGNVQILIKGSLNAQGASTDSIRFEDGLISQASESKFFLSFQETNLSNSALSYLQVESRASNYDIKSLFLRVSKETEHQQAPIKVTGTLTVSNSSFLGNYLATDGYQSSGKLVIKHSYLNYTTVYGAYPRSEPIEIRDSKGENSRIYSGSYNAGILLSHNSFYDSEFLIGCCGANLDFRNTTLVDSKVIEGDGNPKAGPINIANSKFINSPIHLPSAYVIADKSVFFVDKNLSNGSSGTIYVAAPLKVGRLLMTDCYVNGDGGRWAIHISGYDGYNISGESKILNSTLVNYDGGRTNGVLGLENFASFVVNNSNFYSHPLDAISNLSSKPVDAKSNYFDQYTTSDQIEETIYHYNDYISYGVVDYSGFLNTPASTNLLMPPVLTSRRKHDNTDYLNQLSLSFGMTHPSTTELRVYSTMKDNVLDTVFIQSISEPFSGVDLPTLDERVYSVAAVDNSESLSWFSTASNSKPVVYRQTSSTIVDEDNDGRMTFKVVDKEQDLLKVSASIDEAGTSLMNNSGLQVNQLSTDGDTTFFELILTPLEDEYGQVDNIKVTIQDGINLVETLVGPFIVNPVNDYKPELTEIRLITGGVEDYALDFQSSNFWYRVISSDQDGDEVRYLLTELISGKIEGSFEGDYREAQVGDTLYRTLNYSWTPSKDQFGELEAFKLRATDGEFLSDDERTAIVEVAGRNDPPITDPIEPQFFQFSDAGEYEFLITGVSPGLYEDESVTMEMDISSDNDFVDGNDVTFEYLEDKSSYKVKFKTNNKDLGVTDLRLRLSDGALNTVIYQPVIVLPYPNQIDFVSPTEVNAYAELEFNHIPEVETQIPVQVLPLELPESLSANLTWRVATFLGTGVKGDRLGGRISAQFNQPNRLVKDSRGNYFIMDRGNFKIYKVTPSGEVSLFAGGTHGLNEGIGSELQFKGPSGITIDGNDNLYVIDDGWEDRLIKITPEAEGTVIIGKHGRDGYVDGPANVAELLDPSDVLIDSKGHIYIIEPIGGRIRKLDTNNNVVSTYFDTNEWAYPTAADINSRDEIIVADHFSHNLYKVKNGVMEIIPLPNQEFKSTNIAYLTDDVVVFNMEVDNLLKLYTFNLITKELNQIAGAGAAPFIEEGNSLHHSILGFELFVDEGRILVNDERRGTLMIHYQSIDKVKGVFDHDDVGEQELSLIARDIFGVERFHSTVINVSPSDKVTATNLNQSLTYTEDAVVDLEDIVISGTTADELIEVLLSFKKPNQGILSAESGSGESYVANSGEWSVIGTTGQVNTALAQVQFIPTENLDKDSQIEVRIIRNGGHVPNTGTITLEVIPVNDPLVIEPLPADSAYNEIPYFTDFSLTDPDDYYFDFEVLDKPDWLTIKSEPEVFAYSGSIDEKTILDGSLDEARYVNPSNMVRLEDGTIVFLDQYSVRKISPTGVVSTIAGSINNGDQDGPAANAKFGLLSGIAVDQSGNIYFGDTWNNKLKMLDREGVVRTIAGESRSWLENGWKPSLYINLIRDMVVSPEGELYILEGNTYDPWRILKLSPDKEVEIVVERKYTNNNEGAFSTFGGGYVGTIAFSPTGKLLMAGERYVWEADLSSENITVLAGNGSFISSDGQGTDAGITIIRSIEVDDYGNTWFLEQNRLRVLTSNGVVRTIAGSDTYGYENGVGEEALFNNPLSLVNTRDGFLLIADSNQGNLRRVRIQSITGYGTPSDIDLGSNQLKVQFSEGYQSSYLLDMEIEVRSNGMPVLIGMEQTFFGVEDEETVSLSGMSMSGVTDANIELSLTLSNPNAGKFKLSTTLENGYNEQTGEWRIKGTQTELNDFLNSFEFYPQEDFSGTIVVGVKAKRENGFFTREAQFQINLSPVNDDPVLISPLAMQAMEGLNLDIQVNVEDGDNDMYVLDVENMPDWMALNIDLSAQVSTLADFQIVYNENQITDGGEGEAKFSSPRGLAYNLESRYFYVADKNKIRRVSEQGEVVTIYDAGYSLANFSGFKGIKIINDQIYLFDNSRIFRFANNSLEILAGNESGFTSDVDGSGTNAYFNDIRDVISDGNDGFFIASRNTLRHMSADFLVKTVAGNGFVQDELGNPFYFDNITAIQLDTDGSVIISSATSGRKYHRLRNEVIEYAFPLSNSNFAYPTKFFAFENSKILVFLNRTIYLYDSSTNRFRSITARGILPLADGDIEESSWGNYSDIVRIGKNRYAFFDNLYGDIRVITLNPQYKLTGVPTEGATGSTNLVFKITDVTGNTINKDVPLEVLPGDRPDVTGLPQAFNYIEDDPKFDLDPIEIVSGEENEIFEVSFRLYNAFGTIQSSHTDLSLFKAGQSYHLKASKSELNNILTTLSFEPSLNNSYNGYVEFNIRKEGGKLFYKDYISLNVTPVNDLPTIESISDTVSFVNENIIIPVEFNDPEDGKNLSIEFQEKPSWLTYRLAKSKSELVAGDPNGDGFFFKKELYFGPYESQYMAFNSEGEIIMTDAATHSIVKIADSGEVSLVAGKGKLGYLNGSTNSALFHNSKGVAISSEGLIYVADAGNNVIRLIDLDMNVSTLAGTGENGNANGTSEEATFAGIRHLELSEDETKIYIQQRNEIRVLDLIDKEVSTLLNVSSVTLNGMNSFDIASNGDFLIAATNAIYRFNSVGQYLYQYGAGYGLSDGYSSQATLSSVRGIKEAKNGEIYFTDAGGTLLRKINNSGFIETLAGVANSDLYSDGLEDEIQFRSVGNLLIEDNAIYVADRFSLRRIWVDVPVLYGLPEDSDVGENHIRLTVKDHQDGIASEEFQIQVFSNDRLQVSGLDTVLFAKESTNRVELPEITIEADLSENVEVKIAVNEGIEVDLIHNEKSVLERQSDGAWLINGNVEQINQILSCLHFSSENWSTFDILFEFKKLGGRLAMNGQISLFIEPENDLPIFTGTDHVEVEVGSSFDLNFDASDLDGDILAFNSTDFPGWLTADSTQVVQEFINTIYSESLPDSSQQRLAVNVSDIAVTHTGDTLIVDGSGHRIMKLVDGKFEVFAGTGEAGYLNGDVSEAQFNWPRRLLVRSNGDILIGDRKNASIRLIDANGQVSTLLGSGPIAQLSAYTGFDHNSGDPIPFWISGLVEDVTGSLFSGELFSLGKVDDTGNYSHLSGNPAFTFTPEDADGALSDARFYNIKSLIALGKDSILIWDSQNYKLKLLADNSVRSISGFKGYGFKDGSLEEAQFSSVSSSELLRNGKILFFDDFNLSLRELDLKEGTISTIAGKGYQGPIYGNVEDVVFSPVYAIKELSNGDVLLGGPNRIDRLSYTVPTISGTPQESDIGEHSFTLFISDGKGKVKEQEITINVLAPNTAPAALDIPSQEETYAPEGQFEVSLFDYFRDAESTDQELTYEVVSIDSEAVVTAEAISSTDGVLNMNVQGAGEANVTLKATDTRGKSVTTTFAVNIAKAEAEIMLGELEFVNSEAETPVTVTTVPSGLNYTLTYDEESAVPSTVGEYIVKVVIDDANYQGETTATLKVLNIVPEDIQISGLTVLENSASATVIGLLSTTDQNSTDTHTYELESGVTDNDSFEINGSNLVVKDVLDFEEKSTYSITVTATDNYEGSYSKTFSISVTDVNEEPTINEVEAIEIVRNLGELSLTVTGLSAGEEANQTIELNSSVSGIVESSSISINSDNESATLNFQTIQDQTGSGTIEVTIKDNGGTANGGVDTKTITISVDVLGSNIAVKDEGSCGPGSINLSASGADDYNWYTSALEGTSFATSSSIEVNVTETKTYYVAGIFSGIESKLRIPVTASLYSIPDVPTVTNNQGTLTTTEVSNISYQWTLDGEEIEGATSSAFEPVLSGQYSLRATNANGCSVTSELVEVVLAGIEDGYQEISAKIYPVPATDVLELEFEETLQKGTTIKLLSNIGTEFSQTTLQQATRQVSLDVSYLPEGTHIVLVRSENKLLRKKFIVIR